MAKIPFNIKYRPQIESGEYKVVTGDGKPVRIICWDRHYDNQHPIVALAYDAKKDIEIYINASVLGESLSPLKGDNLFIITPEPKFTEFEEAVGELIKEAVHNEVGDNAVVYAIGRGWTDKLLNLARKELREELQAHEDHRDSFMGSVISSAYERGKAEALKDLPRWKKCGKNTGQITLYKGFCRGQNWLEVDGYKIMLSDLEKLPKED